MGKYLKALLKIMQEFLVPVVTAIMTGHESWSEL